MNIVDNSLKQLHVDQNLLTHNEVNPNIPLRNDDVVIDIRESRDRAVSQRSLTEVDEEKKAVSWMSRKWIWKQVDKVLFLTCTIGGIVLFIQVPTLISQFKLFAAGYHSSIATTLKTAIAQKMMNNPKRIITDEGIELFQQIDKQAIAFFKDMSVADSDPHLFSRLHVIKNHFQTQFVHDCIWDQKFWENTFTAIQLTPTILTKEVLAFAAAGALAGYGFYLLVGRAIPAVARTTNRVVRRVFNTISGNEPPRAPIRTKSPDSKPRV